MKPQGARAWIPIVVSILALLASCAIPYWTRSDQRRESATGAYAAVIERVATVEEWQEGHETWARDEDRKVWEELHLLRGDLATTRTLSYDAKVAAETGAEAGKSNQALLLEVLEQLRRNGDGHGKANGIGQ